MVENHHRLFFSCVVHAFNLRRRSVTSLVGLFLFLLAGSASAWTLSGVVYGGSSPLPDATVSVIDAGSGNLLNSITTNLKGDFSFSLENGTYNIVVTTPANSGFASTFVNGIAVSNADIRRDIVLLGGAQQVYGYVYGANSVPLPNVSVNLISNESNTLIAHVLSDATGYYEFGVAPGNYAFSLEHYGAPWGGTMLPEAEPSVMWRAFGFKTISVAGDTPMDLQLPFVRLSGKTVTAENIPVGNVTLNSFFSPSGFYGDGESSAISDDEGNYVLVVNSGTAGITMNPPTGSGLYVTALVVNYSESATRNLSFDSEGKLNGRVLGAAGVPLPNVFIAVISETNGRAIAKIFSDSTGAFGVGLPLDTYSLYLEHYGAPWGGKTLPEAEPSVMWRASGFKAISVAGDTPMDLQLPFVRLSGKTVTADNVPVGNVLLNSFFSPSGIWGDGESSAVSDAQGNYVLVVNSGTAGITMTPPAGSGLNVTALVVNYADSVIRDLSFDSEGILYGRVLGAAGVPLPNVFIAVISETNGRAIAKIFSDSTGAFGVGLPLDTYSLNLEHYGAPWGGKTLPEAEPSDFWRAFGFKTISVAGDTPMDLQLPFVRLSGKTTDSNSVPVSNVTISNSISSNNTYMDGSSVAISNLGGDYSLVVTDSTESINILPPIDSGFAATALESLGIVNDRVLDIILPFVDRKAPVFLAGPLVTQLEEASATILWQTDEPAKGDVSWTGGSSGSLSENAYVTHHDMLLTGLNPSTTYTVTVTAKDRSGNGPTNGSVTFTTKYVPDTTAPLIIAGPTVSSITDTSALIEWETNEPATSVVSGEVDGEAEGWNIQHRVVLSELFPLTTYNIQIESTDQAGNGPTTRNLSFTTLAATDTTPPVITKGPWFIDVTVDGASVVWETDEPANSGVSFNDGVAYGVLNDDALTTAHSVRMTGLLANTDYSVIVSSTDAFGNGPTLSEPFIVGTLGEDDQEPPAFIEAPTACNVNQQLILLCFSTDEPASIVVAYGTDPDSLTQTEARAQLIRQHSLPITGLTAATHYYFLVNVRDQAGNEAQSTLLEISTTPTALGDPQFVTPPRVTYQGKDRAVIRWETDRPCDALIEYGIGNYDQRVSDGQRKTQHNLVVTNLEAGQTYQFRVTATDMNGLAVMSGF